MLQLSDAASFRHSRVALVFRTVIVDRAGEMRWHRAVAAEVVETDISGTAILLTADRTHLQFPIRALHKPTDRLAKAVAACPDVAAALQAFQAEGISYVGGQEVWWDIHSAVTPAVLRHLTVDEIAQAIAEVASQDA